MDAPRGTLIACATTSGDLAQDGAGDNRPYSAAPAAAMQTPNVPVEQMFKSVRRDVMSETRKAQVPWEASSLTGDFFFQEAVTEAGTPQRPTAVTQTAIDKVSLFWQSIKDSSASDNFDEFLRQFPDGIFAGLARNRLAALSGREPDSGPAITTAPTNDRGEPNNSFGTALPLKLGSSMLATILPRGDLDWYRISAGWPGNLSFYISESPPELDMSMRVWNNEKQTISGWLSPLRAGGEMVGDVAIPAAGTYYIEVRDGRDDARSTIAYRLAAEISQ